MKVILVRHGETNKNVERCYLGHFEAELNDTGRQQIYDFVEQLKTVCTPITYLYTSNLLRAMESAQIIGDDLQITPVPVFSLRELDFGEWDCKTYESIWQQEQDVLETWIENPFQVAPPNGETLEQLGKRMDDWFQHMLLHANETDNIVIVSHGGPIRWFLSKWVHGNIKEFWNVEGVKPGRGLVMECNKQTGVCKIVHRII